MNDDLSIDGIYLERYGNQWIAFARGIRAIGKTPMMAYIKHEKAQMDQLSDDLAESFSALRVDQYRMEVSR